MARVANDPEGQKQAAALQRNVEDLRWSPGRDVEIEYRWPAGDGSRAQALAKELVDWRPDILVANSAPSLVAARRATSTIPIVFVASGPRLRAESGPSRRQHNRLRVRRTQHGGKVGSVAERNCAPPPIDHGHIQSRFCAICANVSACNRGRPRNLCIRTDNLAHFATRPNSTVPSWQAASNPEAGSFYRIASLIPCAVRSEALIVASSVASDSLASAASNASSFHCSKLKPFGAKFADEK